MSNLMQSIDERARLAGVNRLEVLLFSLGTDSATGRDEVFGINVFKVREVMHVPEITHAPDMPAAVEGLVSLRGAMIPVVNLPDYCGVTTDQKPEILMVTEYNKHTQGFLVRAVDTIVRLDWEDVKAPPEMLADRHRGLITAVADLQSNQLVMIMDVEKILKETTPFYDDDVIYSEIESNVDGEQVTVLFADDSMVARDQISKTLDHMRIKYIGTKNGAEAWHKLNEIANRCDQTGRSITDEVNLVLTDIEMPEMDGYVLTRNIKGDQRFTDLSVVMHSSLTTETNQALGNGVGADAYVAKFEPQVLAATLEKVLSK